MDDHVQLFHRIYEQVPIGLYVSSRDGHLLDANPALLHMLGFPDMNAFTSSSALKLYVNPEDRQRWLAELDANGTVRDFETRLRRSDGSLIWVRDNASAVLDADGALVYYEGSLEDITDRKVAEAALRESEERFRRLFELSPDPIVLIDPNTPGVSWPIVDCNQVACTANGYTREEMIGRSIDLLHPEPGDLAERAEYLARLRAAGSFSGETLHRRKDGSIYPVMYSTSIVRLGDRELVFGIDRDITEIKRAQQAERDQRVLAEALRDIATTLNATLDLNEVLDRILTNLENVVPYDAANIMLIDGDDVRIVGSKGYDGQKDALIAFSHRYSLDSIPTLREMSASGRSMRVDDTALDPAWATFPETRWVRSYAGAPVRSQDHTIGFINLDSAAPGYFTRDHMTRLEAFAAQASIAIQNAQFYQMLKDRTAEVEQANRELEAFSHTVAHDLKAPLQTVIGYSSVLQAMYQEKFDEKGQDMLEEMKTASFVMAGMIESLLLLARLRRGEEQLVPVDMVPVAQAAVDRFKGMIADRGIVVTVDPEMPAAMGYGPWIAEVLANLISNAIKYIGKNNPAPCIIVRGERMGMLVRYEVTDNGLGISRRDQERLFEMFSRFHTEEASGLGLGMSIVQRIVDRLHGQLGVESTPGKGSTFWFALAAPEG